MLDGALSEMSEMFVPSKQVAGHSRGARADRHLRVAEAAGEIARGRAAHGDARLQRGELHEADAPVQRQLGESASSSTDAAGDALLNSALVAAPWKR